MRREANTPLDIFLKSRRNQEKNIHSEVRSQFSQDIPKKVASLLKSPIKRNLMTPISHKSATTIGSFNLNKSKFSGLREKLLRDWKGIYRALSNGDSLLEGIVKFEVFEKAIHSNKVFISKTDLAKMYKHFQKDGGQKGYINYRRISAELGLHSNSINQIDASHKFSQNLNLQINDYVSSSPSNLQNSKQHINQLNYKYQHNKIK